MKFNSYPGLSTFLKKTWTYTVYIFTDQSNFRDIFANNANLLEGKC
jgi:hypothetical protein